LRGVVKGQDEGKKKKKGGGREREAEVKAKK